MDIAARSNARSHFTLTSSTGTATAMTVFGGGFGAWVKAWNRARVVLFPGHKSATMVAVSDPDSEGRKVLTVNVDGVLVTVESLPINKL